jgi:hypothetical protein
MAGSMNEGFSRRYLKVEEVYWNEKYIGYKWYSKKFISINSLLLNKCWEYFQRIIGYFLAMTFNGLFGDAKPTYFILLPWIIDNKIG